MYTAAHIGSEAHVHIHDDDVRQEVASNADHLAALFADGEIDPQTNDRLIRVGSHLVAVSIAFPSNTIDSHMLIGSRFDSNGNVIVETHDLIDFGLMRLMGDTQHCGRLRFPDGASLTDPELAKLSGTPHYIILSDWFVNRAVTNAVQGITGEGDNAPLVPGIHRDANAILQKFIDIDHGFEDPVLAAGVDVLAGIINPGQAAVSRTCVW